MRKAVLVAAMLAVSAFQAGAADKKPGDKKPSHESASASGHCYSPAAIEAEQAILFQTNVMVVSSTCLDTTYAEFRLRNRDAIIAYQKAMIAHFHGERGFDSWSTALANEASRKQGGVPTAQVCQQSAAMMKTASLLDPKGLHDYAAAQAATVNANYTKCGR